MATDAGAGLPGTALSPFDPTPPDAMDPFSSTGPWAGPPETWQDLESSDDGRRRALSLGRRHGELLQRLEALGDANGGGLTGVTQGMLRRLEAAQLLTQYDRERLTALMSHLRASAGPGMDQEAAMTRLQELHAAIVDDPASKPLALAIAAVALDSVTSALATDNQFTNGYAAGYADAVGTALGGFAGPLGSISIGIAASHLAEHTHVSASISYD